MDTASGSSKLNPLSSKELDFLVALNGSESFKRHFKLLYEHFYSFEKIYEADEDKFLGVPGIAKVSATALPNPPKTL